VQIAVILFGLVLSILGCLSVTWLIGQNLSIPGATDARSRRWWHYRRL